MADEPQLVVVLDDDHAVLSTLCRMLVHRGFPVRAHADPDEMFAAGPPDVPSCLLLDHLLNGEVSGLDVYHQTLRRGWLLPTVFLTAYWDVRTAVEAMRAGAVGFLTKPYDPEELIAEVAKALAESRRMRDELRRKGETEALVAGLTERERMVVELVVTGHLNKEIAGRLEIALPTVKLHRGRAMRKLGAGNAAELARIFALAGGSRQAPPRAPDPTEPG